MDVLATTQPYSISMAPSPTQLELAARKLLAESSTGTQILTSRKDLSLLLSLLLRLRLYEPIRQSRYHLGELESAHPGDEDQLDILMNAFGGINEGIITSSEICKAMEMMVSTGI